ncbi:hypothetical protein H7E67_11765 [Clostridium gasigenes]|uniref:hypothetical protein n=1 Tax=Clostridium gasigenes TaxID=94869 RepID=UPI001627D6D6|nr:hypothetical protein [Clostridium gasigenes]MBB6624106.1 hypothetical protein [Clostridium gasigenes]
MEKILYFLLIINPLLSVLLDAKFDYYRFLSLIILSIVTFLMFKREKMIKYIIIILSFFLICFAINFNSMYSIGKYFNHTVWILNFIVLLIYFSNESNIKGLYRYIDRYYKNIAFMILGINVFEFILIITKKGFVYQWEGTYFKGSNSMPHTAAYLMIVLISMIMVLYEIRRQKKIILLSILPIIIIMLTGARASLGILAILILVFILRNKLIIKSCIISIITLIIGADYIKEIPVTKKFLRQIEYGQFSSGRDLMTDIQLEYFNQGSRLQKIIGVGPDKTYLMNSIYYGLEVWAHNDLIQVLVGYGYIGVIIYMFAIVYFLLAHIKRGNILESILIVIGLMFLAVSNGLYSYSAITLAIPILSVLLYSKNNRYNIDKS